MITNNEQKAILTSVFGGITYAPKTRLYLAAIKEDGTEVSAPSYQRIALDNTFLTGTNPEGNFKWVDATDTDSGYVTNNTYLSFPEATNAWGNIKAIWIYDSLNEGNLLYKSEDLAEAVTVEYTNLLVLVPNTLKITLA